VRVLFVQRQPCIRTLKYAEGFRARDAGIELLFAYQGLTLSELYGHGDECFSAWHPLGDDAAEALAALLAAERVDVIHCHNGPDTLTNHCIDLARGRIPIIHDVHDLMSARETAYDDLGEGAASTLPDAAWIAQERRAMELSDTVIAVSDEIFAVARNRGYRLPPGTITYANYIPERFIPRSLPPRPSPKPGRPLRMVYEGSLNTDGGHYDLRAIFTALAREGIEVHIYPSRDNPAYRALSARQPGVVYHEHVPPRRLYEELTDYDVGWAGFNDARNVTHLQTVLPNKLFEYVACGLPVVSFRHQALESFITEHGVGMVVDRIAGLDARLRARLDDLRRAVARRRGGFSVEANIDRIVDVYRALAAARRPLPESPAPR
jgi:glycosyltransferase involved in cell wall biosynthesis